MKLPTPRTVMHFAKSGKCAVHSSQSSLRASPHRVLKRLLKSATLPNRQSQLRNHVVNSVNVCATRHRRAMGNRGIAVLSGTQSTPSVKSRMLRVGDGVVCNSILPIRRLQRCGFMSKLTTVVAQPSRSTQGPLVSTNPQSK